MVVGVTLHDDGEDSQVSRPVSQQCVCLFPERRERPECWWRVSSWVVRWAGQVTAGWASPQVHTTTGTTIRLSYSLLTTWAPPSHPQLHHYTGHNISTGSHTVTQRCVSPVLHVSPSWQLPLVWIKIVKWLSNAGVRILLYNSQLSLWGDAEECAGSSIMILCAMGLLLLRLNKWINLILEVTNIIQVLLLTLYEMTATLSCALWEVVIARCVLLWRQPPRMYRDSRHCCRVSIGCKIWLT